MQKEHFFKRLYKERALIIISLPVLIYLTIFNYLPMFGMITAFKKFEYSKGFIKSDWVGLKNFEFLFKSADAWLITRNTVVYNAVFIVVGMFCAIALAIMFDLLGKSRLNRMNQMLVLFPHFISWVVASYFVSIFLDVERGIANSMAEALGASAKDWYAYPEAWPIILPLCHLWKSIGYSSIIYYSNIKGFNAEYYEAAQIDGATWLQQIYYITVPLLKSICIIMLILSIGSIFNSDFGLFYLVPRGSGVLYRTTSTIDTYVYNGLMKTGNIGMSSATGFYQSVVGFVLVLLSNGIVKRISPEDCLF